MIRSKKRRLFALLVILGLYGLYINMYFHKTPATHQNTVSTFSKHSDKKLMDDIQEELDRVRQEEDVEYKKQYNARVDTEDTKPDKDIVPIKQYENNKTESHRKKYIEYNIENSQAASTNSQAASMNSQAANKKSQAASKNEKLERLGRLKHNNEPDENKEKLEKFQLKFQEDKGTDVEGKEISERKRVRMFDEHPENKADKHQFEYQKYVGIVRRHARELKEKCKKLEKKSLTLQDKMMIRLLTEPRPLRRKRGESLMDPATGLLVCHTPKAGSSTWVNIFTHIYSVGSDKSRRGDRQQELWEKQEKQVDAALASPDANGFFRIVLVRHPFERLASAFKNKIVYNEPWILSKMILSIKEFIGKPKMNTSDITFKDVVRYIVTWPKNKVDRHFLPMTIYCNPCLNNYDGVIKMDKFNEETKAVLLDRGYQAIAEQIPILNNNNAMITARHQPYFSQLNLQDINDLDELYKWDFELFGYKNDLERFYSLVES